MIGYSPFSLFFFDQNKIADADILARISGVIILVLFASLILARASGDSDFPLCASDIFMSCSSVCFRPTHILFPFILSDVFALVSGDGLYPFMFLFPFILSDIFARVSGDTTLPLSASDIFARCSGVMIFPLCIFDIKARASGVVICAFVAADTFARVSSEDFDPSLLPAVGEILYSGFKVSI